MVKGVFRQQNTSSEPLLDPILFLHDTRTYQDGDKYSVFRWEIKRGGGERDWINEWMICNARHTRRR